MLSACDSSLPESQPGNRVQTSYISLDQRPVRGGTAILLPAPVSAQALIGPNTTAEIVVETFSAEDDPDDPSARILASGIGTSAAGYAIGSAGAITLGTAMVLTGPLLLPLAFEEADIAADRRTIIESMVGYGFSERLEEELIRALDRTRSKTPAGPPYPFHVELQIDRYGLVPEGIDHVLCFAFEGMLQVREGTQTHYHGPIIWSSARRSEDLPPVRCAGLDTMARGDGSLAKQVLREASIILSAAVVRRLSGRSS